MANIITSIRIIGASLLIPLEALGTSFMIVYLVCGISDVLDGYVARKFNIVSNLGSKLDSVADLLLFTIMMHKILPYLKLSLTKTVFLLIDLILVIRIICYIYVWIRFKTFSSEHLIINKVTGVMVFLIPFMLKTKYFLYYAYCVCFVAIFAAIQEFLLHINRKN